MEINVHGIEPRERVGGPTGIGSTCFVGLSRASSGDKLLLSVRGGRQRGRRPMRTGYP